MGRKSVDRKKLLTAANKENLKFLDEAEMPTSSGSRKIKKEGLERAVSDKKTKRSIKNQPIKKRAIDNILVDWDDERQIFWNKSSGKPLPSVASAENDKNDTGVKPVSPIRVRTTEMNDYGVFGTMPFEADSDSEIMVVTKSDNHPTYPSKSKDIPLEGTETLDSLIEEPEGPTCVCGQQLAIDELLAKNQRMIEQISKLKAENKLSLQRCLTLTDSLNSKILGQATEVFTEIEGFETIDSLKKISQAAMTAKSDFIFVKLLMFRLWPDGLKNYSKSGRSSNNPHGRPRKDGKARQARSSREERRILDPEKITYLEERFYEHRLFQGDSPAVARSGTSECGALINRVLAYYARDK
ncbi:uncharacterized protein LOC129758390 [Uranotaenia lowii]|uniref:uncharacterized protein LOC129758390 n=1 Tax=Uranotaenia lowii TaxID=190385 RepID=UPI00247AF6A7|nr:uncharacterized protein LOC129758390 [Uranotaenia lowii]